ncbi:sensor histidine kinase [Mobilicoccus pelagius]|uniref:Putative two-component histidine kinase n=1 Tax=Mobilicoccus pelagius NBRC 104925 TaxID=1089455 RepID=H5UNK7_9MICO|nr:histidine kinase [Mobilicoccus pelagius]GAB47315.1 putative two-component histidine kinase [Mobilicoccus pelagius NBRC 104925]
MSAEGDARPRNPWVFFGWLMSGVWLGFLVFPAMAVWASPYGLGLRVAGMLALLAFAGVFVYGCGACWSESASARRPLAHWLFAVLLVLTAALVPFVGIGVLALAPFLVSFLAFTWPVRMGLLAAGVVWVAVACTAWIGHAGEDWGNLFVILGIVSVSSFATRIANTRGLEYDRAMDALRLADERERVARDVHDVLGHSLTVVAVKAELAERLLEVDVDRARNELAEIRALTRTALAEVRETVGGLRVAALADEIDSARTALGGAGIRADLPHDLSVVDPRHRTVLAWVLREAVTNVVRHSGARACRVSLGERTLVVEDDGRGLRGRREGNGIRGLRERVEGVGGHVDVGPGERGVGTRVEVTL